MIRIGSRSLLTLASFWILSACSQGGFQDRRRTN